MELKRSLREQVRDFILAKIANGEFMPGDRVVEARLIEELHASNIPVREAIRELVAKRVLDAAPHKGAWVRKPSVTEAIEVFQVRGILDAGAAYMAVDQLRGNCDHLRKSADGVAEANAANDVVEFVRHDMELHRAIIKATGNASLLRARDTLTVSVYGLFASGFLEPVDPEVLLQDHTAIIEALDRGDAEEAASLLKLHPNRVADWLSQALANQQAGEVAASSS